MSGLPQTIVSSSKPVNRERRGTGTTLVTFSQFKYAWKATQIPAHSLPHSSYRLVKFMEAVVQSQASVLGSVLGGDSSVPSGAEMKKLFGFLLRVPHLLER